MVTSLGLVKLGRADGSVMAMGPKVVADALGLKEDDGVDQLLRSLRDHVRLEIDIAAEMVLPAVRPGPDVPRDL